ncbi:diaminobutyrate--2-oxoglutarate transaminase [Streptomyces pluripotens]|uniref:Diaminobutyrate--2-oxoglutarate transaminase n=1 Tax=Streptomyces pluripotens TaxID=1355015 RepID=A0A221P7E5_9ACTN|nr:diaminobutyrate--2-oxoglutarate transaminase [Streptomyces pluripotens]ARP73796.1 diaminobutyrate--2-oxoglutarate transaminase [Streptomyces pluripotens]ASN28044.1 diaminobutyrate--2-oxoglutarate transaminase [Streptomyces pluripotens]
MTIFDDLDSEVRSYSRMWPVVFDRAEGSRLFSEDGRPYLDFFAGAGALNYGHNNAFLKQALLDYIARDGVSHALDMFTVARRDFLQAFQDLVLTPRGLPYKTVFPGPGGANAVEAALKLARRVTGRQSVVSFTNSFHGMTLGALAVSGNRAKRAAAGVDLTLTTPMPYDGYPGIGESGPRHLDRLLSDGGSGLDRPAAIIVETVQGEGGLRSADADWLRDLVEVCTRHEVLLIVDDVQMGCGRTGSFFSFEDAGITPDMVCLSKSIGGFGLPLALTLIRSELDVWKPGDHSGTFRGVSGSFVTGAQALRSFWSDGTLEKSTRERGQRIAASLAAIAIEHPEAGLEVRGRGFAAGLRFATPGAARAVCVAAFEEGLLMETSGAAGDVVKLLPPLTISDDDLDEGLDIIRTCVGPVLARSK